MQQSQVKFSPLYKDCQTTWKPTFYLRGLKKHLRPHSGFNSLLSPLHCLMLTVPIQPLHLINYLLITDQWSGFTPQSTFAPHQTSPSGSGPRFSSSSLVVDKYFLPPPSRPTEAKSLLDLSFAACSRVKPQMWRESL